MTKEPCGIIVLGYNAVESNIISVKTNIAVLCN